MQMPKLSLQMWSLRNEMAQDPEVTFRRIPQLGFDGIETAGDYGWSLDRWLQMLEETKLSVVGAHVGLTDLESRFDSIVQFQKALGNERLIVPSLPSELQTPHGYEEAAVRLNKLAASAADSGMEILYHNHAFEFQRLQGGSAGMSTLLDKTDPSLLRFEFDTFWLEYGGENALQFIRHHASRVGMVHAKEMRRSDRSEAPAGQGDIEFPGIIKLARQHHWPVVVEYEGENALEVTRKSAEYLLPLLS